MSNKIIYQKNEEIGPWGCVYLEERPKKNSGNRRALFKCSFCNNTFEAEIQHVKRGNIRSCGCQNHNKKYKDLINQRFGKLTAIKPTNKRQSGGIVWLCKCDCGNYTEVLQSNLTRGRSTSCGCRKISKGEERIEQLLKQNKISYIKQKVFNNCINPKTNHSLRFDFYLPDYNCCIEYDGIQHFQENSLCSDSLQNRQYRDNIKNQYCLIEGIKLIRIPYTDYNLINEQYFKKIGLIFSSDR